jgi:hypothetical protein
VSGAAELSWSQTMLDLAGARLLEQFVGRNGADSHDHEVCMADGGIDLKAQESFTDQGDVGRVVTPGIDLPCV